MKAIVNLFLGHEGCEKFAKQGIDSYWHWHIYPRIVAVEKDGKMVQPHNSAPDPLNAVLIGVAEVELPGITEATDRAVAVLHEKIKEVRAEATKAETELRGRINELLSITYQEPQK